MYKTFIFVIICCSELSWCVNNSEFSARFQRAIDKCNKDDLSEFNKTLLKKRFIPIGWNNGS